MKDLKGFSTTELLICVSLLGIISSVALYVGLNLKRVNELYSSSSQLYSWLVSIQKSSTRLPSEDSTKGTSGCTVTFKGSGTYPGSAEVAEVSGNEASYSGKCNPEAKFRLPGQSPLEVSVEGDKRLHFTSRGTATNTEDLRVRFRSEGVPKFERCVTIYKVTGFIDEGDCE